jgi:hypothetical protein
MKTHLAKIVGIPIALLALGTIGILGVHAQQRSSILSSSTVTTNWVGCVVVGRNDDLDRITPNPSPTVIRQVEIGLRSDGVVVWRAATDAR